jgi:hypothetical protein
LSQPSKQLDPKEVAQALRHLGPEGHVAVREAQKYRKSKDRLNYMIRRGKEITAKIRMLQRYKEMPVDVQEFIESPRYLNSPGVIYPLIMREIRELNSGKYIEAVLTGGIGTGKTTIAIFTTAYQLYLLSLLKDPHAEFNLSPTDEIVIVFQSITSGLAKSVDYSRFRELLLRSPYFTEHFAFDKSLTSEMRFPNRIIVKPVSGSHTAAIGQNVIGGVIDEVNFMAVVEKSKQNRDGGTFDQAWENYNAIVRRRESRFMVQGTLTGMLCLVSSKQYPGEFTDVKIAEAKKKDRRIFVYDKRAWEVKPLSTFSGRWFDIFVGDATRKPYIMEPGQTLPEQDKHLRMAVPEEYRHSFENDMLKSLRDIAGVSTLALHPFFHDTDRVVKAFGRTQSILSRDDCDFAVTHIAILPDRFKDKHRRRFVHIDLAVTGDSAGVVCGYVNRFVEIPRGGIMEVLPEITIDFILEVRPPKNGEIIFDKIRVLLYKLRELGLQIAWVTADTYQSTDTLQTLRMNGFATGVQSMDVEVFPYDITKQAIYDGRLLMPLHPKCQTELTRLERDPKKNLIDHPPNGSKDCADALAGVVFGLTMRRAIWMEFKVPLTRVPVSLLQTENTGSNSVTKKSGEKGLSEQ